MIEQVRRYVNQGPMMPWKLSSRCHLLWQRGKDEVWVKRDDELGFISNGPKRRKHASFFAKVLAEKVPGLSLEGSPFSNNLVAMAATCKELQIPFRFKSDPLDRPLNGNALLNQWIAQESSLNEEFLVVPEGTNHPWALRGALTLGLDIEGEFDQIICDAGTGFAGAALSLTLQKSNLIILKVAPSDCSSLALQFAKFSGLPNPKDFKEFQLSASLRPTNAAGWRFIKEIWQSHGILLDPIYNVRSFFWTKEQFESGHLKGKTLLVHSGGGLSLLGFEKEMKKLSLS